ncbi:Uncharacterised protein [Candidatus Tiddalikarchaeum anstoanum]|nr:Uncharacterised protein [Candidatus Tiddalikarchaeum anstoanum]
MALKYEDMKVNVELMKKMVENNRNCLCKLNTPCPCNEFLGKRECVCGIYKKK